MTFKAAGEAHNSRHRHPGRRAFRRSVQAQVGLSIVLTVIGAALLAPLLARYSPLTRSLAGPLAPPSVEHLLGTDEIGRDVLARLLFGAQVSLQVAAIAVGISLIGGVSLGLSAGYFRGPWDALVMRTMDALLAFPSLLLAIAITAALGSGLTNAMIAIGIVNMPAFARLTRSQALAIRELEFVDAARLAGSSNLYIMLRHVLANALAPIVVFAATSIAHAILTQASLAFLGLGAAPPTPDWGAMLQTGYAYAAASPWLSIVPGGAIAITTLGFVFLGDGLRDILDPRLRGR